jgi:PAS domain S-box-containing protein
MSIPLKVLVVDDDEVDRLSVKRALRQAEVGAEVVEASDAEAALLQVRKAGFDCVILDYDLPGGNGLEIVERMRGAEIATPVIVLTGHGDEQLAVALIKAGASDYLPKKALNPEVLARSIHNVRRVHAAETQARDARRQLEAERRLLRAVLKQLPTGVILAEAPSGRIILRNDQSNEILGDRLRSGETFAVDQGFVHPDGRPFRDEDWPLERAVTAGEVIVGEELQYVRDNGTRATVRASAGPVRNAEGVIVAGVMAIDDVTDEKRAQEALLEEARLVQTLGRIGGVLTAELELRKVVQTVTDESTALIGAAWGAFFCNLGETDAYSLFALSGVDREGFADLSLPADTPPFAPTFQGQGIVRLDDISGDSRYAGLSDNYGLPGLVRSYMAVPVVSRAGTVLGGLFFGHPDPGVFTERAERIAIGITGWASVAIDNARLYEQARRAVRARDEVLAVVSHDLRNPLNTILVASDVLRVARLDETQREKHLQTIKRSVRRAERLIQDLLDVARIESGRFSLNRGEEEVGAIMQQVASDHEHAVGGKGLELVVDHRPDAAMVMADRERLLQVFDNLIANAVRYTGEGGRIEVRAESDEHRVRFTVADTGSGIAADDLPHIFDRFWQAREKRRGGAGLGLAIVRGIISGHGGKIEVHSTPGEGTRFTFTIPAP